jgi:hypothetical protein
MLYRDEDVELCEAHIVNRAFDASSQWTVQRKDVDGFFGSAFESDFVVLKDRERTVEEVITDSALSKRFRPTIEVDGKRVEHYAVKGPVPKDHSRMILGGGPTSETHLALKMPPEDVKALANANWQVRMEKDARIPALVSLLKATHLTLFHMLGYEYALSAGGVFLGRDILGTFFESNTGLMRHEIAANAKKHFREFAHMVRPALGVPATFQGTADDNALYICERGSLRWGLIVFVRTGTDSVHAVLAPLFEEQVPARVFMNFLRGSADEEITSRLAWFRGDRWEAAVDTVTYRWPKTGVLYPD